MLQQQGNTLLGQSLPHPMDSRLKLNLSVEESVATGGWTEHTSPIGYYRGATYRGSIQLLIDAMGRSMTGKWIGFGKNFETNTGDWQLLWVDGSTSKQVQRKYRDLQRLLPSGDRDPSDT